MDTMESQSVMTSARMLELLEGEVEIAGPQYKGAMAALAAFRGLCLGSEEVLRRANIVYDAMPDALELLDLIEEHPIEADKESDTDGLTWKQVASRIRSAIKAKLAEKTPPALRRAVCLQLLRRKLSAGDAGEGTATALLDWAVKEKFIVPDTSGFARFRGKSHAISRNFGLGDQDCDEIKKLIVELCRRAKNAKPAPEQNSTQAPAPAQQKPKGGERITAGEAWWDERLGKFSLAIPPANGHDKGGTLEMEAQQGSFLFVFKAGNGFGHLENLSIPLSAIKAQDGTIRGALALQEPVLEHDALESWRARMGLLFNALRRGFIAALAVTHDMDPVEFLSTGAVGDAVIRFDGIFKWRSASDHEDCADFENLALRFARRHDGAVALTEILSPEAETRLEPELGKYYHHGYAFQGLPAFLMLFLKASYGRLVQGR